MISATGSAAAISAIFGNPLVAAIMFLEVIGLARRQTMLVVLPCLVSSGIGALVFTGLGDWTGLEIGVLAIPHLEPVRLVGADIAWAVPLAAVVTAVTSSVYLLGRRTARQAATHLMSTTIGAGILAGCAAAAYAVVRRIIPGGGHSRASPCSRPSPPIPLRGRRVPWSHYWSARPLPTACAMESSAAVRCSQHSWSALSSGCSRARGRPASSSFQHSRSAWPRGSR